MIIKKVVFIVNPISGTKGKEAILKQIESSLDKNKYTSVRFGKRTGKALADFDGGKESHRNHK